MNYNSKRDDTRFIIDYLDQIRAERKISIKDFTDKVMSVRNYTRLLNKEAAISFEALSLFLEKLSVPLFDFGGYLRNSKIYENLDIVNFVNTAGQEDYETAYKEYYTPIKDKLENPPIMKKLLPISVAMMEYKLNMSTKYESIDKIKSVLQLSSIISSKVLFSEDLDALGFYMLICNDEAKTLIGEYLYKVLFNKKTKILTGTVELSTIQVHLNAIMALTRRETIPNRDHKKIYRIFKSFLEYDKKAKMAIWDYLVFRDMKDYNMKCNIKDDLITYHYISSVISIRDSNKISDDIILNQNDIDVYYDLLKDEEFARESMYERLIKS